MSKSRIFGLEWEGTIFPKFSRGEGFDIPRQKMTLGAPKGARHWVEAVPHPRDH